LECPHCGELISLFEPVVIDGEGIAVAASARVLHHACTSPGKVEPALRGLDV
jgi:hypothetical protein